MKKIHKILFFMMFFLSGFCGLAYQIVWLRKAFAVFGVITPVISVVVSVFMLGLFIGSWAGGKWIKTISGKLSVSAVYLYAAVEFLIGVGGVSVPWLFLVGDRLLLPVESTGSFAYLLFSGLVIAAAMLPWCVFMGATYPFMMAFLEEQYPREKNGFSFLYLANVTGAMAGTLATAVFLIELFGFQLTLMIASGMNFTVAILAVSLGAGLRRGKPSGAFESAESSGIPVAEAAGKVSAPYLTRTILFITGFCSMGMEVIWTRSFTPALGTLIYSFAALLFTYLLATAAGSYFYRRHRNSQRAWEIPLLIAVLAVSAFFPVVFTDWRVPFLSRLPVLNIIPLCFVLGYLSPRLIDEYSCGDPEKTGRVYAVNIAGCVLGPLAASYLLLPFFGSRVSLVILSLPLIGLFISYRGFLKTKPVRRVVFASVLAAFLFCSLFISSSFEEGFNKINGVIRHDYTATVVSYGKGFQKHLLVNGVGMTSLTPLTKDMAHMPLVSLDHKPQNALMICMGMGTTLRSLASWGIDVTAVDLVPGVRDAFGYYHADAGKVLSLPNVRVIVDDGRRYLRRTNKKFDVITIDPPPPVQAAGSSLLYSEEFYSLIKTRLKPGGILQQWFPEGYATSALAAVTTSLTRSFPHVLMYRAVESPGYHYLASMSPIHVPEAKEAVRRMPPAAKADRLEWEVKSESRLEEIWNRLLKGKMDTSLYTKNPGMRITDDRPFNEYYMLRYFKKLNMESFASMMKGRFNKELVSEGPFFISNNSFADAYNNRGIALADMGRYEEALKDYDRVISLKPENSLAYNNRGIAYARLNRDREALKDYDQAISLKPDFAEAYYSRGNIYAGSGQNQKAIDDFSKALELNPYDTDARVNRAAAGFNNGDRDAGCRDARKACESGSCSLLKEARARKFCP